MLRSDIPSHDWSSEYEERFVSVRKLIIERSTYYLVVATSVAIRYLSREMRSSSFNSLAVQEEAKSIFCVTAAEWTFA